MYNLPEKAVKMLFSLCPLTLTSQCHSLTPSPTQPLVYSPASGIRERIGRAEKLENSWIETREFNRKSKSCVCEQRKSRNPFPTSHSRHVQPSPGALGLAEMESVFHSSPHGALRDCWHLRPPKHVLWIDLWGYLEL